jgi:hypothetical protein
VQAAAEITGYNIQHLRRILRSGTLKGCKIDQMWLIEVDALEAYLKRAEYYIRPPLRTEVFFLNWCVHKFRPESVYKRIRRYLERRLT